GLARRRPAAPGRGRPNRAPDPQHDRLVPGRRVVAIPRHGHAQTAQGLRLHAPSGPRAAREEEIRLRVRAGYRCTRPRAHGRRAFTNGDRHISDEEPYDYEAARRAASELWL